MVNYEGYHSTTLSLAKKIVATHQIFKSVGDKHWLGNGAYFFLDAKWVPWWWNVKGFLAKDRGCIKCKIAVSEDLFWDIDSPDGKEKLKLAYDLAEEISLRIGNPVQRPEMTDGAAINFLAAKTKIKVVKGTFSFPPDEYPKSKLLERELQIQIAVRDERCVSAIQLCSI